MKLRLADGWNGLSYNGGHLERGEFAYILQSGPAGDLENPVALTFHCPNKKRLCRIDISRAAPIAPVFQWDGNRHEPTIAPSIGCDHRCGWHGHIIKGELLPSGPALTVRAEPR